MKIEPGAPVVAELRGEEVLWTRLHLAAAEKTWNLRPPRARRPITQSKTLCEYEWPPLKWVALCGLKGLLYSWGAWIRWQEIPFCAVCREVCNAELRGHANGWTRRDDLSWNRAGPRPRHVETLAHSRARHEERAATIAA